MRALLRSAQNFSEMLAAALLAFAVDAPTAGNGWVRVINIKPSDGSCPGELIKYSPTTGRAVVWIGSDHQPSAACNYHAPAGTSWDTGLGDRTHGVSSTCSTWVR